MKLNRFALRSAAALSALLLLVSSAASCGNGGDDTADTAAPTEPVTMPNLTDTREPTMVVAYEERLSTAFQNRTPTPAEQLTYTVSDADTVTVTGYIGGDVVVILPSEIEGKPVVAISEDAFAGKGSVRGISIPDSVTEMPAGAFAGCAGLSTLRIPRASADGMTHFGSLFGAETYETNGVHVPNSLTTVIVTGGETVAPYAFYDCDVEVVGLPAATTDIGAFAFYGCDKLAYIPLGKTALRTVGEHAFTNCASLLSLDLPATVTGLGFAMLEGCGDLELLTLPFVGAGEGVPTDPETEAETDSDALTTDHLGYIFGAKAYAHSAGYIPASLITVTVLAGCETIPANAFFECASIREVILPEGVKTIERRAFYGCARLSKMAIPDSVTTIGDDAFHGCIRLVDLKVGTGLSALGVQVFMDCLSLGMVSLPPSVIYLPNATFAGCRSLVTLTAPGVTSVGSQTFRHCDKLTGWDVVEPIID